MDAKKYLIVGGSSGIGIEIVNELANRGDEIYVGSRTSDKLAGLRGVHHLRLDVAQPPDLLEGLPEALHGVAYCPGTIRLKPFQRLTREDFLEDLQVNFLGAAHIIKACLPNLKNSATGASIVLFSTVAVTTGMPFHASIAAAKGAVEGLTRSLAAELAPRIRVNAIAPSLTDTDEFFRRSSRARGWRVFIIAIRGFSSEAGPPESLRPPGAPTARPIEPRASCRIRRRQKFPAAARRQPS